MDREALTAWLQDGGRTWRWNEPTDKTHYDAVEGTRDGLRWYRWSHVFRTDGVHGEHDVEHQPLGDFARSGPARPVPDAIRVELEGWVAARARG